MIHRRIPAFVLMALAAVLTPALAGCASLIQGPAKKGRSAEAAPAAAEGREQAVSQIEQRRDRAQFAAALARASEGDLDDCEVILRNLLGRNPAHREGRLLLAETLLATHKPAEAEEQLRLVLKGHPDDPQAHFLLAALLETSGRDEMARSHFERAASADADLSATLAPNPSDPHFLGKNLTPNRQGRN